MSELRDTFLDELSDIYDAEKQILEALPKIIEAASDPELKGAFEQHLHETEGHIERLVQVFEIFHQRVKGKKCKGMQGLLAEGEEIIDNEEGDAAVICAAQKVEHYEIAAYGSLCSWARLLDNEEVADLLEETLEEEKMSDEKLTEIAETAVNVEESEEEGEEEEPEEHENARSKRRVN